MYLPACVTGITWNMRVVFYTAYNKYVIDALRSAAFDFLQKPVDSSELQMVMSRLCEQNVKSDVGNVAALLKDRPFMVMTPTGDLRFFACIRNRVFPLFIEP